MGNVILNRAVDTSKFLKLTGGTLTGQLNLQNKDIKIMDPQMTTGATGPSVLTQSQGFAIEGYDGLDGNYPYGVCRVYAGLHPDNRVYSQICVQRRLNGNLTKNAVSLLINKDGKKSVEIDRDAWLNALQVLPLSGGTLTGSLSLKGTLYMTDQNASITNGHIVMNTPNLITKDSGQAYGQSKALHFNAVDGRTGNTYGMGVVNAGTSENGDSWVRLRSLRKYGSASTDKANDLVLYVNHEGKNRVFIDNAAWWDALGSATVARGGTGRKTLTKHAILTGNNTTAVNEITTKNGAFYAPAEGEAARFGTLPVAQGGTGATTAAAGRKSLQVNINEVCTTTDVNPGTTIGGTWTKVKTIRETKIAKVYSNNNLKLLTQSGNTLNINLPSDFDKSLGCKIDYWPNSNWNNGAIVSLARDNTLSASTSSKTSSVSLTTVTEQNYTVDVYLEYLSDSAIYVWKRSL